MISRDQSSVGLAASNIEKSSEEFSNSNTHLASQDLNAFGPVPTPNFDPLWAAFAAHLSMRGYDENASVYFRSARHDNCRKDRAD